jgi:hypothetical protein
MLKVILEFKLTLLFKLIVILMLKVILTLKVIVRLQIISKSVHIAIHVYNINVCMYLFFEMTWNSGCSALYTNYNCVEQDKLIDTTTVSPPSAIVTIKLKFVKTNPFLLPPSDIYR